MPPADEAVKACCAHGHHQHNDSSPSPGSVAADQSSVSTSAAALAQATSPVHVCPVCKVLALRALVPQVQQFSVSQPLSAPLVHSEPVSRAREILLSTAPRGPPVA
jgi:hypothetical protein